MRRAAPSLCALALAGCTAEPGHPLDDVLRLNHVQMKGTHNSYHVEPPEPLDASWRYTHAPLAEQLETQGVRGFELDVHFDAQADAFAVHHLSGIDAGTTCRWFRDCLAELRTWSDAHPGHHPLLVLVEPKDDLDGGADRIAGHLDELDAELLSVWPRSRLLVPDDVRGAHPTLAEALRLDGWPTLGAVRGKALFVFHDRERAPGEHHHAYTRGLATLDGRAMFVTSVPGDPYAAVAVVDDPVDPRLAVAVAAGLLVRTTADDDPGEDGRPTSRTRLDAALASGAHVISTDHPVEGTAPGYWLDLAGGTPSRCHPTLAPPACTPDAVESPERLAPRR